MIAALAFLTVFGRGRSPDGRTMDWFPVVGAMLGLAVGGTWWLADRAFDPLLAAALVVAADVALTGMLHLDGLADSADGLLPHLPRERRLEVMAEPTLGAFAAVAVVLVLLLRTTALAGAPVDVVAIVGIWCASRSAMALAARTMDYARPDGGLATAFGAARADRRPQATSAAGVAAGCGVLVWSAGAPGAAAATGLVLGSAAVLVVASRRIGGFTGDVLGAAGVLGETAALVVLAARW